MNAQKKGTRINKILNVVGMSHLGEALDSHTLQVEVCNQL